MGPGGHGREGNRKKEMGSGLGGCLGLGGLRNDGGSLASGQSTQRQECQVSTAMFI